MIAATALALSSARSLGADLPNPKQNGTALVGRSAWYPYYAGYSPEFVSEVLRRLESGRVLVVADPWNGAGTTTQVAGDLGHEAWGFDINPAAVTVAKARTASLADAEALRDAFRRVSQRAKSYRLRSPEASDGLGAWLTEGAASAVRAYRRAIRDCLGVGDVLSGDGSARSVIEAAFCWTVLFRAIRDRAARLKASNPTWIRKPGDGARVRFSLSQAASSMSALAEDMLLGMRQECLECLPPSSRGSTRVHIASSESVPLGDSSVDVVVSSPPYCTRIEYAVSTAIELAVLGYGEDELVRQLRGRTMGTSTIRQRIPSARPEWGPKCLRLLNAIENHPSKASRSYYLKTHLQYFDDLYRSLLEIDRYLRPGGDCVLVLQDSYYKDVHNDLPGIVVEMSGSLGWTLTRRRDFPVRRSMASVNRAAKRYGKPSCASESAVWFNSSRAKEKQDGWGRRIRRVP